MSSEKRKCKHCGAELPFEKKKVVKLPINKLKQIFFHKCQKCGKENRIIFRPSSRIKNNGTLRMFLFLV